MVKIRYLSSLTDGERQALVSRYNLELEEVLPVVQSIVDDVRRRGDEAIIDYTLKFDRVFISKDKLRVSEEEINSAYKNVPEKLLKAINRSVVNIRKFHEKQINEFSCRTQFGVNVSQIIRPLERVGIYVPGGRAAYPSTVLMTVVPAKLMDVEQVIVCTPPQEDGTINSAVLVACGEAGVTEIYKVGGAQAIAAMAYGTEVIPKVKAIFGPGNIYVTAAKFLVSRNVRVDLPAGPSELLIISDDTGDPNFIAVDILSQAEHDPQAKVVLLTTSEVLAHKVESSINKFLEFLPRKEILWKSLENLWILVTRDLDEAVEFSNDYAPEHLEIHAKSPKSLLKKVKNAGAIFLGPYSPVAVGDYSAGSNHVLPTGGYAKAYSGLSSYNFVKTISVIECSHAGLKGLAETVVTLAEFEGLYAHAESIKARFKIEK
jgi:histidinol dehydrogenase